MKFIIFILINMRSTVYANTLIIPSVEIKYESYAQRCAAAEYVCTTDYFLSLLKNHKTPQFDRLIDSIDLSSKNFIDEFHNKIIKILNSEELDRTQLSMLIDLLKQTNALAPSLLFKMVQNDLERIQTVINNSARPNKKEFVFIFKEMIPIEDVRKIRTTILKIPFYILHFAAIPYKTDTFHYNRVIKKPLLAGFCGNNELTYKVKTVKYCSIKNKDSEDPHKFFTKEYYY